MMQFIKTKRALIYYDDLETKSVVYEKSGSFLTYVGVAPVVMWLPVKTYIQACEGLL